MNLPFLCVKLKKKKEFDTQKKSYCPVTIGEIGSRFIRYYYLISFWEQYIFLKFEFVFQTMQEPCTTGHSRCLFFIFALVFE